MIIEIILLVLAIPVGYLIAWITRDELVDGRRWFKILIIASIALALVFWFYGFGYISLSCLFITIVSFISLIKSRDRKWIRKKFK